MEPETGGVLRVSERSSLPDASRGLTLHTTQHSDTDCGDKPRAPTTSTESTTRIVVTLACAVREFAALQRAQQCQANSSQVLTSYSYFLLEYYRKA